MIAEIIGIGNEVVDGTVVNTNASWLSQQLSRWGVTVRYHTVIPDEEALMLSAFATAHQRAQLVVVTGGLGPTVDDFTLEVAAKFFQKSLVPHGPTLEKIQGFFKKLGRSITQNQEKQALVPQDATVFSNPVGTAPGVYYQYQGVHFAFFPGVPAEMHPMFQKGLLPILLKDSKRGAHRFLKVLRCFGLPEGQMDHQLRKNLTGRLDLLGARLGFRVRFPTIDVRLSVEHEKEAQAQAILAQAEEEVREKLKNCIFGEGEEQLEEVVGELLKQRRQTVATAESCTGGLLADWITNVPGASEYFLAGVVSYSNQAKQEYLGVSANTLKKFGAVSAEVALEMAGGIRKRAESDFGIAVTGIAGPSGGSSEKPVGTVHIALVHSKGEWVQEFHFPFGRIRFKQVAAATALDRLRRILLEGSN